MPPWSIYLVGLGDEHKFEHVDIPRDIEYNYVVVPNKVKMVGHPFQNQIVLILVQ